MAEDYFEVSYINFDKAYLHGRRADGSDVNHWLTEEEREEIGKLRAKHEAEMDRVLRRIAA